jgi:hypothetical protein
MKTTIALLLAALAVAGTAADTDKPQAPEKPSAAAAQRKPVDLTVIKDKVHIRRGEKITVNLKPDGQRLSPRAPGEKAQPGDVSIRITVKDTKETPFPVKGDPTRPYLLISNSTGAPLHFRVLTRDKGSKEFYEEDDAFEPVEPMGPGHNTIVKCWMSGSRAEEFVVFQLARGAGE